MRETVKDNPYLVGMAMSSAKEKTRRGFEVASVRQVGANEAEDATHPGAGRPGGRETPPRSEEQQQQQGGRQSSSSTSLPPINSRHV
jgi:hypothetical protein